MKLTGTNEEFLQRIADVMEYAHNKLFELALQKQQNQLRQVTEWKFVLKALDDNCIVLIPWCKEDACENEMKKKTAEHGEKEMEKFKAKMAKRAAKKNKKKSTEEQLEQVKLEADDEEQEDVVMPVSMGMKSLCMPLDQPVEQLEKCVGCGKQALIWGLFGRSY